MSSESLKVRDSRFYCFLSDYRAPIFDSARLGLVFSEDPVSGSDFTNRRKSRARILKHGSRRLGESRILPFYTPNIKWPSFVKLIGWKQLKESLNEVLLILLILMFLKSFEVIVLQFPRSDQGIETVCS